MKLHLGCGGVYLKGYVNIDAVADYMSENCPPELMEDVSTTFDNYYKYEFAKGPMKTVADIICNLLDELPYPNESIEEVVMEQVLEHIPSYKSGMLLSEIFRVLQLGGSFVVGVPDIKRTARMLANAKTPEEEDWAIRLIHGTQKNKYSHHYCGFIPRTLKNLLRKYGFSKFDDLPTINYYPAIRIRAYKEITCEN